jgi:hypothetical protein
MKKILLMGLGCGMLIACNETPKENETKSEIKTKTTAKAPQFFGEKITEDGAVPTDSVKSMMGDQMELPCKLSGKIDAVCQKKGCWMELKNADGTTMRVTFKDYGFFMPKDASGLTAIVDGIAKIEETSIADLKEYAKDDGKSADDIAKITEPQRELVFEAKGVILK